jgi:amidohydrolase
MKTENDLNKKALEIAPYIVELRREFHSHPELSLEEERTSGRVSEELEKIGIRVEKLADHCVVGILESGKPGKRLAIRADMDALPIQEENEVPYRSMNPGVMHACGHDGHTAMLLGAARLLKDLREDLHGSVFFCFQSGEEIGRGADVILKYLDLQGGVDQAIAIHLWADIPSGKISVVEGARMAAVDVFDIQVIGKGGHGSRPDLCIDPLKPAAQMLLEISAIPTNRYKPTDPLVIHIGKMEGGTLRNIFPQTANLYGGMRYFSEEARETAYRLINEICEHTAAAYGAEVKVEFLRGAPAVINDMESVTRAQQVVTEIDKLEPDSFEPICASENFAFFLKNYKGFMAFLGIKNESKGLACFHHHPQFDLDEDVLPTGVEFFTRYAFRFLSG